MGALQVAGVPDGLCWQGAGELRETGCIGDIGLDIFTAVHHVFQMRYRCVANPPVAGGSLMQREWFAHKGRILQGGQAG